MPARIAMIAVASILGLLALLSSNAVGSYAAPALIESTFVYVPHTAARGKPLQVVVAVHGIGANGRGFGSELIELADRNDWVIIAPTLHYGDWWNVDQLVLEDTTFSNWLLAYLDNLKAAHAVIPRERVMLFGFSRGAGVVGRFALLHPGRVLAGVALSSGAYTLPSAQDDRRHAMAFPFGVADLASYAGAPFDSREFASTHWFVGVGESDAEPRDVPQVWSPYIGSTRVERAKRFSASLQAAGAEVTLRLFPETRHTLTAAMRNESLSFLRDVETAQGTARSAQQPAPSNPPVLSPRATPVEAPPPPLRATPAEAPTPAPHLTPAGPPPPPERATPAEAPIVPPRAGPVDVPTALPRVIPADAPLPVPRVMPEDASPSVPRVLPGDAATPVPRVLPGDAATPVPQVAPAEDPTSGPRSLPADGPAAQPDAPVEGIPADSLTDAAPAPPLVGDPIIDPPPG